MDWPEDTSSASPGLKGLRASTCRSLSDVSPVSAPHSVQVQLSETPQTDRQGTHRRRCCPDGRQPPTRGLLHLCPFLSGPSARPSEYCQKCIVRRVRPRRLVRRPEALYGVVQCCCTVSLGPRRKGKQLQRTVFFLAGSLRSPSRILALRVYDMPKVSTISRPRSPPPPPLRMHGLV